MNGKGDTYRPVDRRKYDTTMLLLSGVVCPCCKGEGVEGDDDDECRLCHAVGMVEKWVARRFRAWGEEIL